MNARQRIAQLEKTAPKPKAQSDYERWIEVHDILCGIIRDIRQAAAQRGEPEPEGEAAKVEILRVIDEVKTMGVYEP